MPDQPAAIRYLASLTTAPDLASVPWTATLERRGAEGVAQFTVTYDPETGTGYYVDTISKAQADEIRLAIEGIIGTFDGTHDPETGVLLDPPKNLALTKIQQAWAGRLRTAAGLPSRLDHEASLAIITDAANKLKTTTQP